MKELALAEDVGPEIIDVLVWMWTGGVGASTKKLEKMVEPTYSGSVPDDFLGARLDLSIISAQGLQRKSDTFATVRGM